MHSQPFGLQLLYGAAALAFVAILLAFRDPELDRIEKRIWHALRKLERNGAWSAEQVANLCGAETSKTERVIKGLVKERLVKRVERAPIPLYQLTARGRAQAQPANESRDKRVSELMRRPRR